MSSNPDRFAIVKLHPHQPAPDNAIMHGSISAVMERIIDSKSRNAALDLLSRADTARHDLERTRDQETQILARGLQTLSDSIDLLAKRFDALEEQRAEQTRQDEEAEAARVQSMIDQLPDPDQPDTHGHVNTKDLHTTPTSASDEEPGGPTSGIYPTLMNKTQRPQVAQPVSVSLNSDDDE